MASSPKSRPSKKDAAARRARAEEALRIQQATQRRSRRLFGGGILVLVLIVVVGVVVAITHSSKGAKTVAADPVVVKDVTTVPAATFDTVGVSQSDVHPPQKIPGSALSDGGKPELLYVGAEFCPFCAAERWAVVTALSRFGTFSHLGQTSSAPSPEVYPNTATLSFHGSTYTSPYLTLHAYETTDTNHEKLDTVSAADEKVFDTYDVPPLVASESQKGSIPFLDIDGAYAVSGSQYLPSILAGMSHREIGAAIANPTGTVGKSVVTAANYLTAAICAQTGGKPTAVCSSSAVTSATAGLPTTPLDYPSS